MDPPPQNWVSKIPKLLQLDGSAVANTGKLDGLEELLKKRLEAGREDPRALRLSQSVVHRYNKFINTKGISKKKGHPDRLVVEPFGSVVMGIGTRDSDIDLSLEGTYRRHPLHKVGRPNKGKALRNVMTSRGRLYQFSAKGHRPKYITAARIPLVKFVDEPSNLPVDLTVGCTDAVFKSRCMRGILKVNPKFVDLIILVKLWAKRMNINEPTKGTFNSYSLTLLVLTFLQNRSMLTPIQEILSEVRKELIDLDHRSKCLDRLPEYLGILRAWLTEQSRLQEEAEPDNEPCLSQLLVEFLTTFSCLFVKSCLSRQFRQHVVLASSWEGRFLGQEVVDATYAPSIIVEDPFMAGENCARTLTLRGARKISLAIEKTLSSIDRILEEDRDWTELDEALFGVDDAETDDQQPAAKKQQEEDEFIQPRDEDEDEAGEASTQQWQKKFDEDEQEEQRIEWSTSGRVRHWIKCFTAEEVNAVRTDDRPVQVQLSWCTPALLDAAMEAMENMNAHFYQGKTLNFILSSEDNPIKGVADWEVPRMVMNATTDTSGIQGKLLELLESPDKLPADVRAEYLNDSLKAQVVSFIRESGFSCDYLDNGMLRLNSQTANPDTILAVDPNNADVLNEEIFTELYASLLAHASELPLRKKTFVALDNHLVPQAWVEKMYKHIGKKYLKLQGEKSIYYEGQFLLKLTSPPAVSSPSIVPTTRCAAMRSWMHHPILQPFRKKPKHASYFSRSRKPKGYPYIRANVVHALSSIH